MGKGDVRELTVAQAAKIVGIHPETFRVHIRKGEIATRRDMLSRARPYLIEMQELIRFARAMGRPID